MENTSKKGIKSARFSWVVGGLQTLKVFIYKGLSDLVLGSNPPLPTKTEYLCKTMYKCSFFFALLCKNPIKKCVFCRVRGINWETNLGNALGNNLVNKIIQIIPIIGYVKPIKIYKYYNFTCRFAAVMQEQ